MRLACYYGLFSDNQPTVHWVQQMASKSSAVMVQLIRVLELRLKLKQVSPLTLTSKRWYDGVGGSGRHVRLDKIVW